MSTKHPVPRARAVTAVVLAAAIALAAGGCSAGATGALRGPPSPTATAVVPPSTTPEPAAVPPAVGPLTMARSVPVRIQIPAIDVDSDLMDLGLRDDGSMEVPPGAFPAGWYTGAPTPGEAGPAVIVGHVDWSSGPGVFSELTALEPEDEVRVTRTDGTVAVFRVTRSEQFAKDDFPSDLVYGDSDRAELRLITCGGAWDAQAGSHVENTVVFAELVGAAARDPA